MSTPAQGSRPHRHSDTNAHDRPRAFTILLVCTGNICRSPAAERLLRSALGDRDDITISSAGLGAMVGQAIDGPMATLLVRRGVDTSSFASRSITTRMIESADLVLTMTRRQQSALLLLVPSAGRRTFLLQEFATLLTDFAGPAAGSSTAQKAASPSANQFSADQFRAAVALAVTRRAARGAIRGLENFDIEDPYRQSDRVLTTCFNQIAASIDLLLARISLETPTVAPGTDPELPPSA